MKIAIVSSYSANDKVGEAFDLGDFLKRFRDVTQVSIVSELSGLGDTYFDAIVMVFPGQVNLSLVRKARRNTKKIICLAEEGPNTSSHIVVIRRPYRTFETILSGLNLLK